MLQSRSKCQVRCPGSVVVIVFIQRHIELLGGEAEGLLRPAARWRQGDCGGFCPWGP